MLKSTLWRKKGTKEELKNLVERQPEQIEKEIFTDADNEGFNQNPSEQQNYPGIQKHKPKNSAKI